MTQPTNTHINTRRALAHLRKADPVLARIIERAGPFRLRVDASDPFASLARAIIYQQISGQAAGTIYARFLGLFRRGRGFDPAIRRTSPGWKAPPEPFPAPRAVLRVTEERLRSAGLSRQKTAYLKDLAAHFASGELSTGAFDEWEDEAIIEHLTQVKGIGRWTAEMFLMFHLARPDVLPVNDVGINRAIQKQYGLKAPATSKQVQKIGAAWRPWATVACWYLWRSEDTALPGG
jgi:DNA-3-methyladenine glycosylase II